MQRIIGIDVSKDTLDAAYLENERKIHAVFANTEMGFAALLRWAKAPRQKLIFCMEATGAYSVDVAEFLHHRGSAVYVENPKLIKSFRESENERNSTDKSNSLSIAKYAQAHLSKLHPWQPLSAPVKELRQLVRMRDALRDARIQWNNRAKSRAFAACETFALELVKRVDAEMRTLEKRMKAYVQSQPELKRCVQLLRSIKGIGFLTACVILSEVPHIALFANKADLVAFAGLNPAVRKSGTSIDVKPMLSKKGSARLRKALYMPAVTALRFNPRIPEIAREMKSQGKHPMFIVGVAMRRLLCYVFGVLRTGEPFWDAHKVQPSKVA